LEAQAEEIRMLRALKEAADNRAEEAEKRAEKAEKRDRF
jgi:hypothetical protein